MMNKLLSLSPEVISVIDKKEKRKCGLEYFYLDETALIFPVFIPTPNPDSKLGVPPKAKVIQLQKYKIITGDLTIYTGDVPADEDWLNPKKTDFYYFVYPEEFEPWFKNLKFI